MHKGEKVNFLLFLCCLLLAYFTPAAIMTFFVKLHKFDMMAILRLPAIYPLHYLHPSQAMDLWITPSDALCAWVIFTVFLFCKKRDDA